MARRFCHLGQARPSASEHNVHFFFVRGLSLVASLSKGATMTQKLPRFRPEWETATAARASIMNSPDLPIDRTIDELSEPRGKLGLAPGLSAVEARRIVREAIFDAALVANRDVWPQAFEKIAASRSLAKRAGRKSADTTDPGTLEDVYRSIEKDAFLIRRRINAFLSQSRALCEVNLVQSSLERNEKYKDDSQRTSLVLKKAWFNIRKARLDLKTIEGAACELSLDRNLGGAPRHAWHTKFAYELIPLWVRLTGREPGRNNRRFETFLEQGLLCLSEDRFDNWTSALRAAAQLRKWQNLEPTPS
jgi:hypothetical protein